MKLLSILFLLQVSSLILNLVYVLYMSSTEFKDLSYKIYVPLCAFELLAYSILKIGFIWIWHDFVNYYRGKLDQANQLKALSGSTTYYNCDDSLVRPMSTLDDEN